MTQNETPFPSCIILSETSDVIMEETADPMQQLNEVWISSPFYYLVSVERKQCDGNSKCTLRIERSDQVRRCGDQGNERR